MMKTTGIDLDLARRVLQTEAAAIEALASRVDERFERAVRLLLDCRGRVIVTGMGKSGIIGRKIAATLASTGTAAFFLHPAEAIHGDLGVLHGTDVIIALSYSGETEVLRLVDTIKRLGARLIVITGEPDSRLATVADVALDARVSEEACPMNLVPTASTSAALALGDALAMTLLAAKGFRPEDFATLHPGGRVAKAFLRVEQIMHAGDEVPRVSPETLMPDVLYEISNKKLGMTTVVRDRVLIGIITDGDLRRAMSVDRQLLDRTAADIMTRNPVTTAKTTLAGEARQVLEQRKITSMVIVDAERQVEGVLHLHDLWDADTT